MHLSRDADFSMENYYAKQERVTRTCIVIFTGVLSHILHYTNVCHITVMKMGNCNYNLFYLVK